MKHIEKTNYFAQYLQKKQQYLALKNKQESFKQPSTEPVKLNSNLTIKKSSDDSPIPKSSNYYKRNHQKVSSTPIELIIPSKKEHSLKYTFEDNKNKDKHSSNSNNILYDELNYPPPNRIASLSDKMTVKHITFFEKKIKHILNIIQVFESENNLNVNAENNKCKGSFIYPDKEPNTERVLNDGDGDNMRMKVYKSLPHSARHNRTNYNYNPSFSSKESTNHFSKKISTNYNSNFNTNKDNGSGKQNNKVKNYYGDEGGNNKKKQYKSCSIKKAKLTSHSNHKGGGGGIGEKNKQKPKQKQKVYKLRNNVKVIQQMNTICNHNQRCSITQLKGSSKDKDRDKDKDKEKRNKLVIHRTEGNNPNLRSIQYDIKPREGNDNQISDVSIHILLDDKIHPHKSTQKRKNILMGIPIKNFSRVKDYLDERTYSTNRQSKSDRNKHQIRQSYGM